MTGNLQKKTLANGKEYYYMVLNFYTSEGKRRPKWIATGLEVKGNKRRAESMLREELQKYTSNKIYCYDRDMLFSDYIEHWLKAVEPSVTKTTFEGYTIHSKHIIDYFKEKKLTLGQLKAAHFEDFYSEMLTKGKVNQKTKEHSGLSVRTVRSYKFIINSALNKAVDNDILQNNPAINIKVTNKTKKQLARKIQFFTLEEATDFIRFIYDSGDILADLIFTTLFFGLRRSEALGITVEALDFKNHLLHINRTVVKLLTLQDKNETKTPDSCRSYPLTKEMETFFKRVIEKKEANRKYYGNTYHENTFLFTWEDGKPFAPDFVYHHFTKLIKKYGKPGFTFHNLRHSTASMLYEKGWHPKDIQEWLGHADFYTTMNIYTHLERTHRSDKAESLNGTFSLWEAGVRISVRTDEKLEPSAPCEDTC